MAKVLEETRFSLPPEASSEDSGKMLEDGPEINNQYMGNLSLVFSLLFSWDFDYQVSITKLFCPLHCIMS